MALDEYKDNKLNTTVLHISKLPLGFLFFVTGLLNRLMNHQYSAPIIHITI